MKGKAEFNTPRIRKYRQWWPSSSFCFSQRLASQRNPAAMATRKRINATGPKAGTLTRMKRNEAPQMAASKNSLAMLAASMKAFVKVVV